MILVTVGMHTQPFDRLVRAADELATLIDEPVIIQRGAATYAPHSAQYVDFVDETQMQCWLVESRVVVSHAGAGIILSAMQAGKPLILVPRRACLNEHGDDHQFELAEILAKQRRAVLVKDLSARRLAEAIAQAPQLESAMAGDAGLQTALRIWLTEQAAYQSLRRGRLLREKHRRR